MQPRSIALQILWWTEIIVSLRILLFFLPVLINKYISPQVAPSHIEDWGAVFLTFALLCYLLTGVLSLMGTRLWRLFHLLSVAVVVVMTLGFMQILSKANAPIKIAYFFPLIISVVIAVLVLLQKENKTAEKG
jgi:hypothetical protein